MSSMFQSKLLPIVLCGFFLLIWFVIKQMENKWKTRERFGRFLLESPITKTCLFVLTVILSGILCSAFVSELTFSQETIEWSSFHEKLSFYWLVFIIVLDFIYNWFSNSYESEIMRFSDEKWLLSNMRKELFSTYMEHMKTQIKQGKVQPIDIDKLFKVI